MAEGAEKRWWQGELARDPVLAGLSTARWWVLAGMVVGLLAGGAVHLATPATTSATVSVQVTKVAPIVDLNPVAPVIRDLTADTDVQLVTSDEVLRAVAADLGVPTSSARESLTVQARPLTRVLNITYTDASQERASAGAEAAAAAFLLQRERLVIEPVRAYLAAVDTTTREAVPVAEIEEDGLLQDTDESDDMESLRRRAVVQELELAGPGRVLEQARISASGNRGDVEVPVGSGAGLGALVGLGLSLGAARRRARASRPAVRPAARAGAQA